MSVRGIAIVVAVMANSLFLSFASADVNGTWVGECTDCRVGNPEQAGHPIRSMPITDSGASWTLIPVHADQ